MKIRKVKVDDYDNIYKLVKEAFKTAKVSDGNEQEFVYELRKRKTYVPELEFVVEDEGKIIGHIMLTKQEIEELNSKCNALLLAPLCIKLEYRNKKIGGKLMQYAFDKAREFGYTAIFLIGDSNYYSKYGFKNINEYNIQNVTGVPNEYVLVYEIEDNSLKEILGKINLH